VAGIAQKYHLTYSCIKKSFQKLLFFFSNQKNTSKLAKLHMRYLIIKFMKQKRMPEFFCFDDLIKNFMVFIKLKITNFYDKISICYKINQHQTIAAFQKLKNWLYKPLELRRK
jgi:hypothetical protein